MATGALARGLWESFVLASEISRHPVWQRLVSLGTKRGIKVFADDFRGTPLEGEINGFWFSKPEIEAIVIDSSQAEEKRQHTLAHELGHHALHKYSGVNLDSPREFRGLIEAEADHFARHLLWWVRKGLEKSCVLSVHNIY